MMTPQPEKELNPASELDDIFVPGVGVRGALDDETSPSLSFPSRLSGGLIRLVGLFRRSQELNFDQLRNIARRSAFAWSSTTMRIRTNLQGSFLAKANSAPITMARVGQQLARDARKVASGIRTERQKGVLTLRATSDWAIHALPQLRARLLRAGKIAHVRICGRWKLQERLPRMATGTAPAWRRDRLLLLASVNSIAEPMRRYTSAIRLSGFQKPTLARLRRAAAPFAILLVIVFFVIQEFVSAAKH